MRMFAALMMVLGLAASQLAAEVPRNHGENHGMKKKKPAENNVPQTEQQPKASPNPKSTVAHNTPAPKDNSHRKSMSSKPVSVRDLTAKARSGPQFVVPPVAKAQGASGPVKVQVTVDEQGRVISAKALSGHPLLQGPAVATARDYKFNPTLLNGQSVRITGTITIGPPPLPSPTPQPK